MAIPGYRILRKIRQGGMSTVYLATQKSVGREVALKVMSPTLSSDPSFGSRFYREAKIVGQLSHPNIVSIYDVGSYKHYNYIAMDYLPGAPLQDKLTQGVDSQDAIRITREIASALDYAHERGYIHRDIKPDNILFHSDGSAVLCDFGIAKARKTSMKMTNVGSVLGTPHYMSPEQAQGKEVDGRSDLYGLGVVLFEMLTGQVPYQGEEPVAVAVKHMSAPIPRLPPNVRMFQPLINKLLAKKPSSRYQSGKDIIAALDNLEHRMGSKPSVYLTKANSTTGQVIGLLSALFTTLSSALIVSISRLFLNKKKLSGNTIQLTRQQLEAIDSFVLDGESEQAQNHSKQLAQKTRESQQAKTQAMKYWLIATSILIAMSLVYYFYSWPQGIPDTSIKEPPVVATITVHPAPPATEVHQVLRETEVIKTDNRYTLTINTQPAQSAVRILNIKPLFSQNMLLEPGSYHVEVSATDYHPKRLWINIADSSVSERIVLEPTRRLSPPGTVIIEKLDNGDSAPEMLIIPKQQASDIPLAFSANEISFDHYGKFTQATGRALPDDEDWGRSERPVINVTYQDAMDYAAWLSAETGSIYRLPKQSEWQFAARAGSTGNFWWGIESAEGKANCRSGCDSQWSKFFSSLTAPVASYPANSYGLYDTAGNVAEWLSECSEGQGENCKTALVAGGSHADKLSKTSSNSFQPTAAASAEKTIGFRLVLEL